MTTKDGTCPRFGKELRFSRGKDVVIELSAFDFAHSQEVTFYYKPGSDDGWRTLRRGQNKLTFAAIPYGKTRLQLASANPEVDKKAAISDYIVSVPYSWYLSWWMLIAYVLLLAAALWLITMRVAVRKRKEYERRLPCCCRRS